MLKPFGRKKLYFIVAGSGRCGTVYWAKTLSAVGIPCSHERIFGPYGLINAFSSKLRRDSGVARMSGLEVNDFILAESSYMAVPYLSYGILSEATIIHAVRNPIDVILSFNNKLQYWHHSPERYERFIASHLNELKQYDSPLMKNCCYVVRWNQWIESQAVNRNYIRVRLEHDTDKLLDYLNIPLGLRPNFGRTNAFEEWRKKRPPLEEPATKEIILKSGFGSQIKRLANNYGYEI